MSMYTSNMYFLFIDFVIYITTTMCDGVLHCLWFVSNVFLVSLHDSITVGFSPTLYCRPNVICIVGEPV